MPTVDPSRDLSHTIVANGTNNPASQPEPPAEAPKPRHRSRAWVWLLILGALGFFGYRYWEGKQQKAKAAQGQTGQGEPAGQTENPAAPNAR